MRFKRKTDMLRRIFISILVLLVSCSAQSSTEDKEVAESAKGPEGEYSENSMLVALSFDDGPNNNITPKVLDILEYFDIPASFFVIGQNINDSTAEQIKRAISLGCEIQNHSYTHPHMTQMTSSEVIDEIKRTDDLIE